MRVDEVVKGYRCIAFTYKYLAANVTAVRADMMVYCVIVGESTEEMPT